MHNITAMHKQSGTHKVHVSSHWLYAGLSCV